MKRIIGLLLVLTMLIGLVGVTTTAAAADAAPKLGKFTMDEAGAITLPVTGEGVSYVYVYLTAETESGSSTHSVYLSDYDDDGVFTGTFSWVKDYPNSKPSSYYVSMEGESSTKDNEETKTRKETYAYQTFYYNGDQVVTSQSKNEQVTDSKQHSWKYNEQEYTDYATTSRKEVTTTVSYLDGKESGTNVTTTDFTVKLAKDPEGSYLPRFSFNSYDHNQNYTIVDASQETVAKGTKTETNDKVTSTTTSDLKTVYKLDEKEVTEEDNKYIYRQFVQASRTGTEATTRKGTRENYTSKWDEETGKYVRVLSSTETVDETSKSTYAGDTCTTESTENNKTVYVEGGAFENQTSESITSKLVERDSYYATSGKETVWETTGSKTESKNTSYRDDGTKSTVETTSSERTKEAYKVKSTSSDYFYWTTRDKTIKEHQVQEDYDDKGQYAGKNVTDSNSEYDVESGTALKSNSTTERYNKKDVLTYESETNSTNTFNTEKSTRIYDSATNSINYTEKGAKSSSSASTSQTESKREKDESGNWTYWQTASSKSETFNYNRQGELRSSRSSATVYNKDSSYTTTNNNKTYNTYTGAQTYDYTRTQKRDADGKYTYDYAYVYNNDDGSLRSKYVQNADGSEVHYNSKGSVVATRDKNDLDGTWKDAAGNVIGKNYRTDDASESTYVSFKERTGEINGYSISKSESKDGKYTETQTNYDGSGKQTYQRVYVSENGKSTETVNGLLKEERTEKVDEEGNYTSETKEYNYKGELDRTYTYDSKTGTNCTYNRNGKLTYKHEYIDGLQYLRWYENGEMYEYGVYDPEKATETRYSPDDKVLWSRTEEYDETDKISYTILKDKNGKEFARTFDKYEDTSKEGVSSHVDTSVQQYYGGRYWYGDYENGSISLEKRVENYTSSTEDGVTTSKTETDYTKWDVLNGSAGNELKRKDTSVYVSDANGSTHTETSDGITTYRYVNENDEYGKTVKQTSYNYDSYTGKPTSTDKTIYPSEPDSPFSYSKHYDQYGNLQTYGVTDDTDRWDWNYTYYADGTLKQESWNDNLDYEDSFSESYRPDGTLASQYTKSGDTSRSVSYNRDGSYSYWADTDAEGVTNAWLYDSEGRLTGYRWNQKSITEDHDDWSEEVASSYEYWDADSNLVYVYQQENDSTDGSWTESYTDKAGNALVYKSGDGWTLTVADGTQNGWVKTLGKWFYLENGTPVKGDWKELGGVWYYFNYDGSMATGFVASDTWTETGAEYVYAMDNNGMLATGGWTQLNDEGTYWAYTDERGVAVTGWKQINGEWYYFNEGWNFNKEDYKEDAYWTQSSYRGAMVTGPVKIWNSDWATKHTYFFNEDGTWDTTPGWKVADNFSDIEYHYYDANGREVTGWNKIDGKWYYFNEDGVMRNGWVKDGPSWYFMDPAQKGAMATDGWVEDKYEDWYYVNADGSMKTGWVLDGGTWYYLNDSGAMATDEWVGGNGSWYYMGESGAMKTGWLQEKDGKTWYYLNESDGLMATGWKQVGSDWYYFNADGTMKTGWLQDGSWYYLNDSGRMLTSEWLQEGDNWYYFGPSGAMVTGEYTIDGVVNVFGQGGVWIEAK